MKNQTGAAPKIRALYDRYPNMSKSAIARRVGCVPSNVTGVLKDYLKGTSEEKLRQFQDNKGDIFDSVVMRSVASITQAKLAKARVAELATVAGIFYDKAALTRGQATSINATVLIDLVRAVRAEQSAPPAERIVNSPE